jgi:molybdate transport system substrate-binding protein
VLVCVAAFIVLTAVVLRRPAPPADAGPRGRVRVAAAADLNAALPAIVARFGAAHDVDVTIAYGSSGTFFAQLLNQAPFDLFLSADLAYPNQLAARGLTLPQSEFTYAVGRLVLWAPASSPLDVEHQGLRALAAPSLAHVAIANPEHAPYGRAAVAALQAAGVYDAVRPKMVFGENVALAMQFAQSGAADAAIVARSLAVAPNAKGTGAVFDIPPATYPRMDQGGVILRWAADADAARALRGFLLSADGRAILGRSGFALPER